MMRKLIIGLVIFLLLAFGLYMLSVFATYSEGKRAGTVMKLSKKGILFKTYEGQLNTGGGFNASGDITSSIWDFSVSRSDNQALEDIEKAIDGGYRVKLFYKEKFFTHTWRGDTKYFVYKVEPVGNKQVPKQSKAVPAPATQEPTNPVEEPAGNQ